MFGMPLPRGLKKPVRSVAPCHHHRVIMPLRNSGPTLKQAYDKAQRYRQKKYTERDFEPALGQSMSQPRSEWRRSRRDWRHQYETDERHVAERERWQQRLVRQACEHVTNRARD